MTRYSHVKNFYQFQGVDLRSGDVIRGRGFASAGTQNYAHWPQGGLGPRFGSKVRAYSPLLQMIKFETTSMLGVKKTELVGVSAVNGAVNVLERRTFTLTNSDATYAAFVTHYYDGSTFRFQVVRNGSTLVNVSLGTGIGSGSTLTLLESAIDAASNLSMSSPTSSGEYAALLDNFENLEVAPSGSVSIDYYAVTSVVSNASSTTAMTLTNPLYEVGEDTFEGVPHAVVRGCLYLSPVTKQVKALSGGSTVANVAVLKYDGQALYRAGLPAPSYPTYTYAAAGTLTDVKGSLARTAFGSVIYSYRQQFKQIDKAGNVIEGGLSEVNSAGTGGDVIGISDNTSAGLIAKGYNTRFAVTTTAQGPTLTLTVDDGAGGSQSLAVGDIAYFWDENQDRFIQREVTAASSGSITLSANSLDPVSSSYNYDAGGNVTVNQDAVMSANLRRVLWRTETIPSSGGASPYYLCEEIPYSELYTYYYDTRADADLGAELAVPDRARQEPPVGRYMCAFNGQLIVTGIDDAPSVVAYSDLECPEYFAYGLQEFETKKPAIGIRQTGGVLAIGASSEIYVVSGDLANFNFRIETVSASLGITSHASMVEIEEGILAVATVKGPFMLRNGRDLQPMGAIRLADNSLASRVEPYFSAKYAPGVEKPVLKRAVAAVLPEESIYILYIPHESASAPGFPTSNSTTWAYDFSRGTWFPWNGLNMASGVCEIDGFLFFAGRTRSGGGKTYANVTSRIAKQQKTAGKYNYADHEVATTATLKFHWEHLGNPSALKRFLRYRISSHEARPSATVSMALKTYVDFDTSLLSTSDTLTWTTEKDIKIKVKGETCRAQQLVLETTAFYQPLPISGIEVEAVAGFREVLKE